MTYYDILKSLDNTIGRFLCDLLAVTPRRRTSPDTPLPARPKVLVMKFWGMGTILLSTPALSAIKARLDPSEMVMLTLEQNREPCESLGIFSEVISCRLSPFPRFIADLFSAIVRLRRKRFDILFDFEFFTHFTALTSYLIDAALTVGFFAHDIRRGNLYAITSSFNSYWHITDIYLNMVRKALPGAVPGAFVAPPADLRDLARWKLSEKGYVVVNPNSDPIALQRRWPADSFVKLIDRLHAHAPLPVVLIGNARERIYNEGIARRCARPDLVLNLGGATSWKELTSLVKFARLVVTNDSGPLHLAAILDTPTISFFGPETPVIYGPKGEQHAIFFENIECSPCMNIRKAKEIKCTKGKADCILQITPDKVWEKMQALLARIS